MSTRKILKSFDEVNDSIQDVCFDLLNAGPFYGHVLSSINRHLVDDDTQLEPTTMKSLTLSSVKLELVYKLWAALTAVQQRERLQHEVLHFVFLHPWKEKPSNVGVFYIACDISANMYCEDKTAFRKEFFDNLSRAYNLSINTGEGYISIYESICKYYSEVPKGILRKHKGDVAAYEAEVDMWKEKALKGEFFEPNSNQLTEAIFFLPQNAKGDTNASGLSSLIQGMKAAGASGDEIAEAVQQYLSQAPDPWEDVAEGTAESAAENLVKRVLQDSKSRGDLPGGLESYVDLLLTPPKIDWRKELRNFTKTAGHVVMSSTMTRRSKRFGKFPASKIRRQQKVAICIDTSGSMSDNEFNQAISEVSGALTSNCQVVVVQADSVVDDVKTYERRLPPLDRITMVGRGGTSFDDALEFVKTGGKLDRHAEFGKIGRIDGVVYITDGYAPAPELDSYPRCKLLWLTTQKTVDTMVGEGFRGKIVKIDCDDM